MFARSGGPDVSRSNARLEIDSRLRRSDCLRRLNNSGDHGAGQFAVAISPGEDLAMRPGSVERLIPLVAAWQPDKIPGRSVVPGHHGAFPPHSAGVSPGCPSPDSSASRARSGATGAGGLSPSAGRIQTRSRITDDSHQGRASVVPPGPGAGGAHRRSAAQTELSNSAAHQPHRMARSRPRTCRPML